jgi:hypothetical protein
MSLSYARPSGITLAGCAAQQRLTALRVGTRGALSLA